tara:strand:- start:302 stop:553 length:252 start_codon:yes stop_codon:yes gene_type:complete
MPSGCYENNELGDCGICGKRMRPLLKNEDWANRKYHVSCFKKILSDISNYNTVAFTKYGHIKKIAGLPEPEARKQLEFKVSFD